MGGMKDEMEQAAYSGDIEFFKRVGLEDLQNYRGNSVDNILSFTASCGGRQIECCQVIYSRDPSQIFGVNYYGNTVLHHAVYYLGGKREAVEFFLDLGLKAASAEEDGKTRFKQWLKLRNGRGETALCRGITLGLTETTELWMEVEEEHDVGLLKIANNELNTPLHLAVEAQQLEVVTALAPIQTDDSDNYAPNNNGETPLMIALRKAFSPLEISEAEDNTAVKIRKLLLEKQPNQVNLRRGEKGWTSLHHCAQSGDLGAIRDIVTLCPDCMKILDVDQRNFLHIAVQFEKFDVVEYILKINGILPGILNGKDRNGYTPLHLAAETENPNIQLLLLYDSKVDKATHNAKGEKVAEAITIDYDKSRAGVRGVRDRINEKELKDQSDFDLVVGALIATVSFTAGLTVPGGYIADGPYHGMALLTKSIAFEVFVISNNLALVFSLYAVFSHFCTRRLLKREDIVYQLKVATFCTLSSIFAMMVAFITGSYAILAISKLLSITMCVNSCCFFIFAFLSLWKMVKQSTDWSHGRYNCFSQ